MKIKKYINKFNKKLIDKTLTKINYSFFTCIKNYNKKSYTELLSFLESFNEKEVRKMEVKSNIEISSNSECVALLPIGIYSQKQDIKKKIYSLVKRIIDIIGGICGVILLIPITIRNFYSSKNF